MRNIDPDKLEKTADSMGISLYQRFTKQEASLFLRCSIPQLNELTQKQKINHIELTKNNPEFFGYQLLEYLLNQTTNHTITTTSSSTPDRIIRAKEVLSLTGLSRTTLWRMENKNQFPKRVSLGGNSVGWKLSEVEHWIQEK